jgi:hypothetical protein
MKLSPLYKVVICVICFSCSQYRNIAQEDLGQERYRYIFDFDSRVAQQKMHKLRSNYQSASAGVFFINAVGNSVNPPQQPDTFTAMPRYFQKMVIINKSIKTLYADLVTRINIDHEHTCSVFDIQLPAGKRMVLLTAADSFYDLTYGWDGDAKTSSYSFNSSGEKRLLVTEQGVNKTVID